MVFLEYNKQLKFANYVLSLNFGIIKVIARGMNPSGLNKKSKVFEIFHYVRIFQVPRFAINIKSTKNPPS